MGNEASTANDQVLDAIMPGAARKDWKDHEQQSADRKKPKPIPKELDRANAYTNPVASRTPFQSDHVDLGEQVAGGHYHHNLVPIVNLDPTGARMVLTTTIIGSRFSGASDATRIVRSIHGGADEGEPVVPIDFYFSPDAPGAYSATMLIACSWSDGAYEEKKVTIVARARAIDQKPETQRLAEGKRDADTVAASGRYAAEQMDMERAKRDEAKQTAVYPQNAANSLVDAAKKARREAKLMADSQRTAVGGLTGYARSFVEEPEEKSEFWKKFGKLGVQIATAGLAAITGGAASVALGVVLGLVEEAAVGHPNDVGGSRTKTEGEGHAGGGRGELLVEGLAAAIEDALKLGVDIAYEEAAREEAPNPHAGRPNAIAFFTSQQKALDLSGAKHAEYIDEKETALRGLLRSRTPAVAGAAMGALASSLEVAAKAASEHQTTATQDQWATYVARARNGGGKDRSVADMSAAHDHDMKGFAPEHGKLDGTLDLYVVQVGNEVRVRAARMTGVSWDIVQRLATEDLSSPTFPIRLLFENGGTVITRDGNGVVRVSGWYSKLVPDARSEADAIPRAQEIVAKLCASPLSSHGITSIGSNDAHKEQRE